MRAIPSRLLRLASLRTLAASLRIDARARLFDRFRPRP